MSHVVVYAMGLDQPGIVAAVTRVLVEQGCNLEDTSMTILRGHFAMMLVVAAPGGADPDVLARALGSAVSAFQLSIHVATLDESFAAPAEGDARTVSVYGADRPGLVHGVAAALAERGVNIVDLTTRVVGAEAQPVYAMVLEVVVPPGVALDELSRALDALAAELGVECSLHPSDADIL